VHQVTAFPGSHQFATDFIETIATDPEPDDDDAVIWGLTADLSESVPPQQQAMYISKSADGGATWTAPVTPTRTLPESSATERASCRSGAAARDDTVGVALRCRLAAGFSPSPPRHEERERVAGMVGEGVR